MAPDAFLQCSVLWRYDLPAMQSVILNYTGLDLVMVHGFPQ